MSDLPNRYQDSSVSVHSPDLSVGTALERVYEAGQDLIVRRIDLLSEELADQGRSLLVHALTTTFGAILALAGWFIAVMGIIGALDDHFSRSSVQIVAGALHVVIGAAIALQARRRRTASRMEPS